MLLIFVQSDDRPQTPAAVGRLKNSLFYSVDYGIPLRNMNLKCVSTSNNVKNKNSKKKLVVFQV